MASKSGTNETYDLTVLGAGPGGYVAAIRAAQLGLRVALVEQRKSLGGTCLNIGCIPSKALLDSSEFYSRIVHDAESHGIEVPAPELNVEAMMKRKDGVVKKLTDGVGGLVKSNKIDVYTGRGRVVDRNTVEVYGESTQSPDNTVRADRLLLATGSQPIELPFLKFDGTSVVSSREALEFSQVPQHLLIVGAGVIGLELGSVWSRLGAKVTVVEILPNIMAGWDHQVSSTMKRELSKQGFDFKLQTKVTGAKVSKKGVTLQAEDKEGNQVEVSGDKVLVAVGRRPNLEGANLEALELEMENDRVAVNERFETSADGVWAIGDIVHGPMLAHKAEDEGIAAAECMVGKAGHVNYGAIPNVVYTWPEAASVGKTENELNDEGVKYRSGSFPFAANGRALAMGSTAGFVKILADAESDRVLGAHIVGPWASDLIAEIASVIEFGGSAEDIARTVHAHPTLSESVKEAALGVDGRMIHARNR